MNSTVPKGYIDWEEMSRLVNQYGNVRVWSIYLPSDAELGDTLDRLQEEAAQYGLVVYDEPLDTGDRVFVAHKS